MEKVYTNWAGNITYQATGVHQPQTVGDVQAIVRDAASVKVVGTRHSFNTIADTTAAHISLEKLNQISTLDIANKTVTIEGGVRYGELAAYLHQHGFALANMASLPHISVVGAVATATHGSGEDNACLAAAVRAIDLVTADGEMQTITRAADPEIFPGVVVNIGALGVVTQMTLDIEPTYDVAQYVYQNLPFAQAVQHFDEIQKQAYSVSLFTDWTGEMVNQLWLKVRVDARQGVMPAELFGAQLAGDKLHPVFGEDPTHCTEQEGIVGAWYERLPHFKLQFTPSSGEEIQSEYFLPREHARAGLEALKAIQTTIAKPLLTCEVRTIAADDLWLSMAYEQDSVAFHFTWLRDWEAIMPAVEAIERALAPFQPRPHWGKVFRVSAQDLHARYPQMAAFKQLCQRLDPERCFANDFINTYLYDEGASP